MESIYKVKEWKRIPKALDPVNCLAKQSHCFLS